MSLDGYRYGISLSSDLLDVLVYSNGVLSEASRKAGNVSASVIPRKEYEIGQSHVAGLLTEFRRRGYRKICCTGYHKEREDDDERHAERKIKTLFQYENIFFW
jgi:hypothetical protein